MLSSWLMLFVVGAAAILVQFLAALPWVAVVNRDSLRWQARAGIWLLKLVLAGLLGSAVAAAVLAAYMAVINQDAESLQIWGGLYGVVLQVQVTVDLFVLIFALLLLVWPKGGAVALAAFREGIRQPMFWFIAAVAVLWMVITPFIPYFSFGDDFKMVKQLGYEMIMLSAGAFGIFNASISISEEIEGRTAVTLMSKPVSRRQFLIGKFVGILLASLVMTALLSLAFEGVLLLKPWYDREETAIPVIPQWLSDVTRLWTESLGDLATYFLRGLVRWLAHAWTVLPGIVLGFCHAMVLLAISVALATRLPMIVNVVGCLVVFFLGNLTPVLAQISQNKYPLVRFMAQLFDYVLPGLDSFNMSAAIARDTMVPAYYVGTVGFYALLYTAAALFLGLILFEDRDLA